ncbi:MAG: alpha/beta hydrolase [Gemmatimonadaceae bacterium]
MSVDPASVTEHHITVERTARYYTLGDVARPPNDIWIVCHGFAQLARAFVERFRVIERRGRLIAAPEALNRYYLNREGGRAGANARVGATWMTREDRLAEIDDYVRYLDTLLRELAGGEIPPEVRVTALGFSQGAAVVSRWLVHGEARLDRVILWSGLLPPEIDAATAAGRLGSADLHMVVGTMDAMIDANQVREQADLLARASIRCRVVEFAGGHELDRATLRELAA